MGHANIETTLDIYAEVTDMKKTESMENLSRNLHIFQERVPGMCCSTTNIVGTTNVQQKQFAQYRIICDNKLQKINKKQSIIS